jgi:hypothetical protein
MQSRLRSAAGSEAAAVGAVAVAVRHSSSLHSRHSRMGSRATLLTQQHLVLWPDSPPVCAIFIGHLETKQRSVRPPAPGETEIPGPPQRRRPW